MTNIERNNARIAHLRELARRAWGRGEAERASSIHDRLHTVLSSGCVIKLYGKEWK